MMQWPDCCPNWEMTMHRLLFKAIALGALLAPALAAAQTTPMSCDDSLKQTFRPDSQTTVVLVRHYAKGETLVLPSDATTRAPKATNDLCLVKLNVGPGNPGPADTPSTSVGIGIEIWLPSTARWNGRIHALGGGGFQGGSAGSPANVASPYAAAVADGEGAVSSTTDAGHASVPKNYGIPDSGGDFLMNPDGSINETLWRDFSERAIHEQAVKTRALTAAYYGRPATRVYWDGSSTGGRQGHKLAQAHPEDFDGIIANLPALYWSRMATSMAYAHIVFQRDLGGKVPTIAQQDLVSNAAITACDLVGGQHLGYILDPASCRYDPTRDRAVLCTSNGGANTTNACVTRKQALAINKIWYGPTADGSAPNPARDNGWSMPPRGKHLWYGLARGTSLYNAYFMQFLGRATGFASPDGPPFLGTDPLALAMQDPSLAQPAFRNARARVRDGWKRLTYAQFAAAISRAHAMDARLANLDTDNPDLSAFKARGGKLLFWHGTNDEVIPLQGSIQYYDSVLHKMGGTTNVQDFYKLYIVPGAGHQSPNGTSNTKASPPIFSATQMYELLTDWVENSKAPTNVQLQSPSFGGSAQTAPACAYPQRVRYVSGDPKIAASYTCAAWK
jgi:hypothetical protein